MDVARREDIFDRLMRLPLLRVFYPFYEKHKSGLLYLFFGAVTTLVNFVVYAICAYLLSIDELVANVVAWVLAVLVAYVTNRIWVFRSSAVGALPIFLEIVKFAGGRVGTLLLEELILFVFVTKLSLFDIAVKAVAAVLVVLLNFVIGKWFVFREKRKNANDN